MIHGLKGNGEYLVEFGSRSHKRSETRVLKYFQERMTYGLFVSSVDLKK